MFHSTRPSPFLRVRPAYVHFLSGVFVSAATNLFSSIVTTRYDRMVTSQLILSASLWMMASVVAFYLGSEVEDLRVSVANDAKPEIKDDELQPYIDDELTVKKWQLTLLWWITIILVGGAFASGIVARAHLPQDRKVSGDVPPIVDTSIGATPSALSSQNP